MTVLDLIGSRAEVYSVRDDVTVHEAARYLREREVRAAGVLDATAPWPAWCRRAISPTKSPPKTNAPLGCASAKS